MSDLVPVTLDGAVLYIESARGESSGGIQEASAEDAARKAVDAALQLQDSIKAFCGRMMASFNQLAEDARPSKAIVEFGLSISAEGNVFVVKTAGEASVKVTAEWEFTRPAK
jgi:hypothetical protein